LLALPPRRPPCHPPHPPGPRALHLPIQIGNRREMHDPENGG